MKRYETLVLAIPDPTPEEQVEGQARCDREALVHAIFHHPWLVHMAEGDWRQGPPPLIRSTPPLTLADEPGSPGEWTAAACRPRSAPPSWGGGSPIARPSAHAPAPAGDAVDHPAHYTSHNASHCHTMLKGASALPYPPRLNPASTAWSAPYAETPGPAGR